MSDTISLDTGCREPRFNTSIQIDKARKTSGQCRVVLRTRDPGGARRKRGEIARVPMAAREATEYRRAARRGVRTIDRVQIHVQCIGEQLAPARIYGAAACEA